MMQTMIEKFIIFQKKLCTAICNKETAYTIILAGLIVFQVIQYVNLSARISSFMNVGPRFTAMDGYNHCNLIRELQENAGIPLVECTYPETPPQ
jgi:hypothetical protein